MDDIWKGKIIEFLREDKRGEFASDCRSSEKILQTLRFEHGNLWRTVTRTGLVSFVPCLPFVT